MTKARTSAAITAPTSRASRKAIYQEYAWKLVEKGAAYPCFCTKERLDEAAQGRRSEGRNLQV